MSGQRDTGATGRRVVEEVWRSSDLSGNEALALADEEKHPARDELPGDSLLADLNAIGARAAKLGVESDATDFDVRWTTDDLLE